MPAIKVDIYDLINESMFNKRGDSCKRHLFYPAGAIPDNTMPDLHCSRNNKSYQSDENNHEGCVDCSPESCIPEILKASLRNDRDLRRYFIKKYKQDIASRKQDIGELKMQIESEESMIDSLEKKVRGVPAAKLCFTADAKKALKIANSKD